MRGAKKRTLVPIDTQSRVENSSARVEMEDQRKKNNNKNKTEKKNQKER